VASAVRHLDARETISGESIAGKIRALMITLRYAWI
jgi:hypothetical protein